MSKVKLFTLTALTLSLAWFIASPVAQAEVSIRGQVQFSGDSSDYSYSSKRTVIIVKESAGPDTIIIQESPVITTYPSHRNNYHFKAEFNNRNGHDGPRHYRRHQRGFERGFATEKK